MSQPDPLLDIPRPAPPRPAPSAAVPLSCYLLPEFWRGAAAARTAPEMVSTRIVAAGEMKVGRHTVEREVVEHRTYEPSPDEKKRNDEMLIAISRLERSAGKRNLAAMPAYHVWLAQGTSPPDGARDGEDE